MQTITSFSLEQAVDLLQTSSDFHVLQRLQAREVYSTPPADTPLLQGLVLDCGTTGLDHRSDRIHSLAMIKFEYTPDGHVVRVIDRYEGEEDPTAPLPAPRVTNGIRPDGMYPCYFDEARIEAMQDGVSIVIAHNAGFDRPFIEKRFRGFDRLDWGCSWKDVSWKAAGLTCHNLEYLGFHFGFFFQAHRSAEDCLAVLEILSQPLPDHSHCVLKDILDHAQQPMVRIWATSARKNEYDKLKPHGYHWGEVSQCSYKEVLETQQEAELEWLRSIPFSCRSSAAIIKLEPLPARVRYADRCHPRQQHLIKLTKEVRHVSR